MFLTLSTIHWAVEIDELLFSFQIPKSLNTLYFSAKSSPQVENESEEEVEKLRRKLMQAQMRHANKAIRHHKSMRHGSMPAKYLNFNEGNLFI